MPEGDAQRRAYAFAMLMRIVEVGGLSQYEIGAICAVIIGNVKSHRPASDGLEAEFARLSLSAWDMRALGELLRRAEAAQGDK